VWRVKANTVARETLRAFYAGKGGGGGGTSRAR
jgi:hypothetical protein